MCKILSSPLTLVLIGSLSLVNCSSDDSHMTTGVGVSGQAASAASGGTASGAGGSANAGSTIAGRAGESSERSASGGVAIHSDTLGVLQPSSGGTANSTADVATATGLGGMALSAAGSSSASGTHNTTSAVGAAATGEGGAGGMSASMTVGNAGTAGVDGCTLGVAGARGTPIGIGETIHVLAGAAAAEADGSADYPFAHLADAVAAINVNLANCISWDGLIVVHAGRYEATTTIELPPNADVEFRAGVTMAMGDKVNLHANRDVKVLGTQSEPVVFTWLTPDTPWGSLTLFMPSSQSNVFEWAIFEHGGQANYQGIAVRGALSLEVAGGRISNCTFANNTGDDALSLGSSPARVDHCRFVDNASDGIDVDGAGGGEISFCIFDNNGNDGLDLGEGADHWVHDNVMSNNGDNGIEIGEASIPRVDHNLSLGNVMGIAIRDDSDPVVTNCTFYGNQLGVVGYNWKSAYGYGKGSVTNSIVWGSTVADVVIEPGATTTLAHDCVQSGTFTDSTSTDGDGNVAALVGEGLISAGAGCDDPLFVDPERGDFHLQSSAGHYDATSGGWVIDAATSPCIDAGDPAADASLEPQPNGGRVNLGAYGASAQASHSPQQT